MNITSLLFSRPADECTLYFHNMGIVFTLYLHFNLKHPIKYIKYSHELCQFIVCWDLSQFQQLKTFLLFNTGGNLRIATFFYLVLV